MPLSQEELTEGLDLYYSSIRQKQKSKSGLLTHEDAAQSVANEIPTLWEQGVRDLRNSLDIDLHLLATKLQDKDPFNQDDMEQALELIDRQLADIIREWQPQDPTFENTIIPYNYNGNSKEFWELYDSLKKKGFL